MTSVKIKQNWTSMKKRKNENPSPPLQPLRIPTGWTVTFNDFYDIEPKFRSWDDVSWNFKEDMLQLVNDHTGIVIDLGWLRSHRSTGKFKLTAAKAGDPDGALRSHLRLINSRSKTKIVDTIEAWLVHYSLDGPAFRKQPAGDK